MCVLPTPSHLPPHWLLPVTQMLQAVHPLLFGRYILIADSLEMSLTHRLP